MSESRIKGLKAKHIMVTPECRKNKGHQGAVMEAMDALNKSYHELVFEEANRDATFHFVLTVDRP